MNEIINVGEKTLNPPVYESLTGWWFADIPSYSITGNNVPDVNPLNGTDRPVRQPKMPHFDGINGRIQMDTRITHFEIQQDRGFELKFWFIIDADTAAQKVLLEASNTSGHGVQIDFDGAERLIFRLLRPYPTTITRVFNYSFEINKFYFVRLIFSGNSDVSGLSCYYTNLTDSGTETEIFSASDDNDNIPYIDYSSTILYIGAKKDATAPFPGSIGGIEMYDGNGDIRWRAIMESEGSKIWSWDYRQKTPTTGTLLGGVTWVNRTLGLDEWQNKYGYTLGDNSTYFFDKSASNLIPSGEIIPNRPDDVTKSMAYLSSGDHASSQYSGKVPRDALLAAGATNDGKFLTSGEVDLSGGIETPWANNRGVYGNNYIFNDIKRISSDGKTNNNFVDRSEVSAGSVVNEKNLLLYESIEFTDNQISSIQSFVNESEAFPDRVELTYSGSNPVIALGVLNFIFETGNILYDPTDVGKEYKMFYSGDGPLAPHDGLHYAYSSDGISWVKPSNNAIIGSPAGQQDPYLVKISGTYYLFTEDNSPASNVHIRLYSNSSNDLTSSWVDHGAILTEGLAGSWEEHGVASPCVLVEGDTIYLYYEGGVLGFNPGQVGLATASISGGFTGAIDWTKNPNNPIIKSGIDGDLILTTDSPVLVCDDIIKIGARYYMTFHGGVLTPEGRLGTHIGVSFDKINWRSYLTGKNFQNEFNGDSAPTTMFGNINGKLWAYYYEEKKTSGIYLGNKWPGDIDIV